MSKANRILKAVCVILAVLIVAAVAVACNKTDKYTLRFVAEGLNIPSITAEAGSEITPPADPSKDGYTFEGWYDNADFDGETVTLPTVMPKANITYYAKLVPLGSIRVNYDANTVLAEGSIAPSYGEPGDEIRVKDGSAYQADGLLFIGWSVEQGGLVSQFGNPQPGQYLPGDTLTLGESEITLYAQWAYEYEPAGGKGNGKIYLYYDYIGKGNGAIILVREGKPNKLGFVSEQVNSTDDYNEFEFIFDGDEDYGSGSVYGRVYTNGTYAFKDGLAGTYLFYDYITDTYGMIVLAADGYGRATVTEIVGNQTVVRFFGSYAYDEKYGDYLLTQLDVETRQPVLDKNGDPVQFNIAIEFADLSEVVANSEFLGIFSEQGYESGSYLQYDYAYGELLNYRLDLNGYGAARLLVYDAIDDTTQTVDGYYLGTDNYEDEAGEWIFTANDGSVSFRFILSYVNAQTDIVLIYIEYDPYMDVMLTGEDGSTLYLDGYGGALYEAGGISYFGNFTANSSGTLLTFVPYIEDGDGNFVAGPKMYFNVDWTNNTYVMDETGYVKNNGTLVEYVGESPIIVIPNDVTAIGDDAFNSVAGDCVAIISVVIHDGVTDIGKRAFENRSTLRRVVFESETPIALDLTDENDPFRWPSGSFLIVVPEGTQDAYKAAWTKYANNIKGSVEVTLLPEFEIEDGVLIRYNVQPDAPEELEIVIPGEVTEIAAKVFRGLDMLKSVDLNNVGKIGEGAFEFCANLENVTFTNVTEIGEGAFNGCDLLGAATDGEIELPVIKKIGDSAFVGCYELIHVTLGADIKSIGSFAFSETNMLIAHGPLFIELTGDTAPEMGEKVFNGNIATRIKVKNIDVVLACFNEPSFLHYNKHLYIESGDEKGIYFDGADTLELDGRAILVSSYVMMYAINGETVTFYEFDEETASYYTLTGTYKNGVISFALGVEVVYNFKKYEGDSTYRSEDGKYTLVCDPIALLPETYEDNGYRGYATVVFNGKQVQLYVAGYNTKKITSYLDEDGEYYDFNLSMVGDTLVYTKTVSDKRILVTAADGSALTLHFTVDRVYIYGTLKIVVEYENGTPVMMPDNGDYGVYAIGRNGNTYTFERIYKNKKFTITVTVSEDSNTFTYTCVEQ